MTVNQLSARVGNIPHLCVQDVHFVISRQSGRLNALGRDVGLKGQGDSL